LREGSAANLEAATTAFDSDIQMIDIAGISCRQQTPQGWAVEQDSYIVYAYGGGYISGSTCEGQVITAGLAQHSGLRIVMVEHRLSPEHPCPLPQQNMRQVYSALLDRYGIGLTTGVWIYE
jgi:acetyl esterase/lipase